MLVLVSFAEDRWCLSVVEVALLFSRQEVLANTSLRDEFRFHSFFGFFFLICSARRPFRSRCWCWLRWLIVAVVSVGAAALVSILQHAKWVLLVVYVDIGIDVGGGAIRLGLL